MRGKKVTGSFRPQVSGLAGALLRDCPGGDTGQGLMGTHWVTVAHTHSVPPCRLGPGTLLSLKSYKEKQGESASSQEAAEGMKEPEGLLEKRPLKPEVRLLATWGPSPHTPKQTLTRAWGLPHTTADQLTSGGLRFPLWATRGLAWCGVTP